MCWSLHLEMEWTGSTIMITVSMKPFVWDIMTRSLSRTAFVRKLLLPIVLPSIVLLIRKILLKSLAVDAGFFLGENPVPDAREAQQFVGSEIQVLSDHEVAGYTRIRGGWNNGKAYTVYFYAETDRSVRAVSYLER